MRSPLRFSSVALIAVFAFALTVLYVADRELSRSGATRLRVALWTMGAVTLTALTISLLHERRLTRRIARRSAELERLSAELLRANRARTEFLAGISHELRTPLNAIVGFVELLRDGVYGPLGERQVGPVHRIESSASHLRQLVDQVLDLAKMTAGRMEVHTEPFDLRPFVVDVVAEIEPLATERGLAITSTVSPPTLRIVTDPTHLRSILLNLLGNAVKFTEAGTITLRSRLPAAAEARPAQLADDPLARPRLIIEVTDTGIGISPGDRLRIFDEFEQVNAGSRSDSAGRGTGLGLPIARRLARLLGGEIVVESAVGRGSTFSVWLPMEGADVRPPRLTGAVATQATV
jgi:signal transduction histidine kinase